MPRPLRWVVGLGLAGLLVVGGLLLLPFSDWLPGGTVAQIPNQEVVNGTAFNRFFPSPGTGEEVVFTQEKRGFSEAKLKRGGELLALLAISDTTTAPEARAKFRAPSERIDGWPLVEQGPQASALLVANRFQVKVVVWIPTGVTPCWVPSISPDWRPLSRRPGASASCCLLPPVNRSGSAPRMLKPGPPCNPPHESPRSRTS
jgi:hypothetical protein